MVRTESDCILTESSPLQKKNEGRILEMSQLQRMVRFGPNLVSVFFSLH